MSGHAPGLDAFTAGALLNAAGGAVMLAFGLLVLQVRPRTAASLPFGVFAAGFGAATALSNASAAAVRLAWLPQPDLAWYAGLLGLHLATVPALVLFAWRFPRPPPPHVARSRMLLVAAVGVVAVPLFLGFATAVDSQVALAATASFRVLWAVGVATLLLTGLRYGDADLGPGERRAVAVVAGVVGLYLAALVSVTTLVPARAPDAPWPYLVGSSSLGWSVVPLATLWLVAMARAPAGAKGAARNVALVLLGTSVLVMAKQVAGVETFAELGIARFLMVGVLAFEILRGRVAGLDLKVRRGVSTGSLAALFMAVFFIASESAQVVFERGAGETEWAPSLGIAAAGGLVFAMAPLSRLTDRLAARTVPAREGTELDQAARDYTMALRAAMRDGRLSRDEELALARLADCAGLDVATTTRIRHEAEAAQRGQVTAAPAMEAG